MTVHEWLDSERDYEVGRGLYAALGENERLKRLFAAGPNQYNREAVLWELQKLAKAGGGKLSVDGVQLPVDGVTPSTQPQNATKTLQKLDSSAEKLDSRSVKAGELLAELKAAQRLLYDERTGVHAQLEGASSEEERRLMAVRVMSLTRQLDANWNTTHYVEAHGELPPAPAAAPGLDTLPATDLLKRRNNLRSQVSKLKKRSDRADDLAAAQTDLAAVEALLTHE